MNPWHCGIITDQHPFYLRLDLIIHKFLVPPENDQLQLQLQPLQLQKGTVQDMINQKEALSHKVLLNLTRVKFLLSFVQSFPFAAGKYS